MPATASKSRPSSRRSTHAITTRGEIHVRSLAEWVDVLKQRQVAHRQITEWIKLSAELASACRAWLRLNTSWVNEIVVRLNGEPAPISLYVVVKDPSETTLQQQLDVADLGLVLGASFNIWTEAAMVSSRPASHSYIID